MSLLFIGWLTPIISLYHINYFNHHTTLGIICLLTQLDKISTITINNNLLLIIDLLFCRAERCFYLQCHTKNKHILYILYLLQHLRTKSLFVRAAVRSTKQRVYWAAMCGTSAVQNRSFLVHCVHTAPNTNRHCSTTPLLGTTLVSENLWFEMFV